MEIDIFEKLRRMSAKTCCMTHEKVDLDENGIPIKNGLGDYQRFLCSMDFRNTQLSCAHTMSRYTLKRAIEALEAQCGLTEELKKKMLREYNDLDGQIGQLDWKKGDLEKLKATLLENSDRLSESEQKEELNELEAAITQTIATHRTYCRRLELLKEEILQLAGPTEATHASP